MDSSHQSFESEDGIESENELLIREARKIVEALGKMFAPYCEVALHDLLRPEAAIVALAGPLTGRKLGDATRELGMARIADPSFPDVVQNYPTILPDGRHVKSTSIGLRNSKGQCVASICLNMDVSVFVMVQRSLAQFVSTEEPEALAATALRARSSREIHGVIEAFALRHNVPARALSLRQRREVIRLLDERGLLQLRGAIAITAEALGLSRGSVYNALKSE